MNVFLILAVAIVSVSADVSSLGYQYNVPQTSYGVPSYQGSSSNTYNTGYTSGSSGSGYNYKGQSGYQGLVGGQKGTVGIGYQPGNGYHTGSVGLQSSSVGSGYQSSGSGHQSVGSSGTGYQSGNIGLQSGSVGSGYHSAGSGGSGYQTGGIGLQSGSVGSGFQSVGSAYQGGSSGLGLGSFVGGSSSSQGFQYQNKYQQQVQFQQGPAQVFKHFYVHAAPEEPEVAKTRNPIVLPPAQKHYKIIFIKTPSVAGGASQVIPVQPQSEEKTIVYVLVKKPEEYQDIAVPKIEQKPPSKPEVYFIKYKNKEDSQAVISNIVNDYNKGQQSVSFSGIGADTVGTGSGLSGASSFSGSSGSVESSGLSGVSGLSSGSGYSGESGSYSGQYNLNAGSESAGSSGLSFSQETESQVAASFGSSAFGSESGSVTPVTISKSEPVSTAVTVGYESNGLSSSSVGIGGASSTSSYDVNTISSHQGIPHETYGIPSFRSK